MTETQVWAVAQPHVVAANNVSTWYIDVHADGSLGVPCGGCARAGRGTSRLVMVPKELVELQPHFGFTDVPGRGYVFCLGRDVWTETGCCTECGWVFRIQQGRMLEATMEKVS